MMHKAIPRYQAKYREYEIGQIIRLARRGESLGFIGVAGVGKSNIVNFLRDIQHNVPHFEQKVVRIYFPVVDATQWQGTPISLWTIILEALNQATKALSPPVEDSQAIPISEEERILNRLQKRLNWLCQEAGYQVMFILDDFDVVIETGPLAMLERLNVLRSEGNRELLSYLVFTKRLPHILGRGYHIEHKSKFYDLFRHNIYALAPYTQNDAMRMLKHLNEVAGNPLPDDHLEQICQLAGGHARLLKIVFNVWVEEGVSGIKAKYFADKPDIRQECQRILLNLHQHEQQVALQSTQGQYTAEDQPVIDHLLRRGLLLKSDPITWFSPLMTRFLATYKG